MRERPFYQKGYFIIIMVLLFPPVGIFLLAKYFDLARWNITTKKQRTIAISIVAVIAMGIWLSAISPSQDEGYEPPQANETPITLPPEDSTTPQQKVLLPEAVTLVTLIEDYMVELIPNVFGILHGWGYHFPDGVDSDFDIIYFEITVENLSDTRFPINSGVNFKLFVEGEDDGRFFTFSASTTRGYQLATQLEPQGTTGDNFPVGVIRGGVDFRVSTGDVITYLAYGVITFEDGEEIWETLAKWRVDIEVPEFS